MPMDAKKYRPSNGSEGYGFIERYCDRCQRDYGEACKILTRSMLYGPEDKEYPKQWQVLGGKPTCTSFRDKTDRSVKKCRVDKNQLRLAI